MAGNPGFMLPSGPTHGNIPMKKKAPMGKKNTNKSTAILRRMKTLGSIQASGPAAKSKPFGQMVQNSNPDARSGTFT